MKAPGKQASSPHDVSAVVVNYHCATDTVACVNSMLADFPSIEVVVVDHSNDAIESRHLQLMLPRKVLLLNNNTNPGFGQGCNQGFAACGGRYVMLLNPDARAIPGCLSALVAALDNSPRLGAVSPVQCWDPTGQWLLPPAWLPTGIGMWALEKAWRSRRNAYRLTNVYRRLALQGWRDQIDTWIPQRALSGGAMMVRREAANAVGGLFDPAFFMYYEDSDLCLRLRQANWQLGLVTAAAALHEWHHSTAKIEMMEDSKSIFMKRHFIGQGQWEKRLSQTASEPANSFPLAFTLMAALPDRLPVPVAWQSNWLLEASPSPLMIPAIGRFGSGAVAHLPALLLERLGGGSVYLRLGSPFADAPNAALYAVAPSAVVVDQASAEAQ